MLCPFLVDLRQECREVAALLEEFCRGKFFGEWFCYPWVVLGKLKHRRAVFFVAFRGLVGCEKIGIPRAMIKAMVRARLKRLLSLIRKHCDAVGLLRSTVR